MKKNHEILAQERFMSFINNGEYKEFFADEKQKEKISKAIDAYNFLKSKYSDRGCNLAEYEEFQKRFKSYYGMQRGTDAVFTTRFFNKMQDMRGSDQACSIDNLEKEICEGGKLHFSFMTRNIKNLWNYFAENLCKINQENRKSCIIWGCSIREKGNI